MVPEVILSKIQFTSVVATAAGLMVASTAVALTGAGGRSQRSGASGRVKRWRLRPVPPGRLIVAFVIMVTTAAMISARTMTASLTATATVARRGSRVAVTVLSITLLETITK